MEFINGLPQEYVMVVLANRLANEARLSISLWQNDSSMHVRL